jgi:hypothetical protein
MSLSADASKSPDNVGAFLFPFPFRHPELVEGSDFAHTVQFRLTNAYFASP